MTESDNIFICIFVDASRDKTYCKKKTLIMWEYTWVKVFRIIPELRILRYRKSASKSWIKQIQIASLIYIHLSIDNWPFKLEIVDILDKLQVWRFDFKMFRIL